MEVLRKSVHYSIAAIKVKDKEKKITISNSEHERTFDKKLQKVNNSEVYFIITDQYFLLTI